MLRKSVKKWPFPLFTRKMLMSAFLLRFKDNSLEKCVATANFSVWDPVVLAKIYVLRVVLSWRKNICI